MKEQRNSLNNREADQPTSQPDPGTLHTTDPQKNMEGPVSSSLQEAGKGFDTSETQQEADEERDRNL